MVRLTDDAAQDWDPAFTHDSKSILWSSNRGGHFEIWTADINGSESRVISRDGSDAENPTETPDGQWIVYNSYNPEKLGVWKIRKDGSSAVRLISGSTQYPEVSPDGKYVSFSNNVGTASRRWIHVLQVADGVTVPYEIRLKNNAGLAGRNRWLPDGRIAFFDNG